MKKLKLFALGLVMAAAGVTTVKAQSADEIIKKHIDAVGGTEKWNKVNSLKMTGSMSAQGMDMTVNMTTVNGKGMRMEYTVMGQRGYSIITPTEGWVAQDPGEAQPIPADQLKLAQDKLDVKAGQLVDKSKVVKSELLGKEKVDSVDCYKVKITDKDGQAQTDYINATNYYLVRTEAKVKGQDDQEQDVVVNFSNFKKLDFGIVYPMTLSTGVGDINFSNIEVNTPVDDNIFKPTPKK